MNATTERLRIRPVRSDDLDDLARLSADPEVMRFSLNGPIDRQTCRGKLQEHIELFRSRGWGMHMLEQRDDDRFVGVCGMTLQTIDDVEEAEVGYRLMPEFWGRGLATEAVRAWIDHCFTELDRSRVIAIIEPENAASIRVAEKAGMTFEKKTWKWDRTVWIYALARPIP